MASIMENFSNEPVDLSSLPNFENVPFQAVSRKYLLKSNLQMAVFMLFILAGWGALYYYQVPSHYLQGSLAFIALYFAFRFWNTYKMQKSYGYALREKDILYRRGFFVNTITVVPFNRIQHASISRDLLDKLFDIASLQLFTAGGSGSDISIPGLPPDLALQLKEALAVNISEDE